MPAKRSQCGETGRGNTVTQVKCKAPLQPPLTHGILGETSALIPEALLLMGNMHTGRERGNNRAVVETGEGADRPSLLDISHTTETAEGICPDTAQDAMLMPHSPICLTGNDCGGGQMDKFIFGMQNLVIQDGLAWLKSALVC